MTGSFVALLTPRARSIDPRGQRFGAGVSAGVLASAFVLGQPLIALAMGVDLAASAILGTRLFLPSRPWPVIRRTLRLPPVEPEHEYPPRFAQALGATFLAVAAAVFAAGVVPVGWALVGAVAGLQTLLAATGVCVGCRLYFLRWWVPALVARVFARSDDAVAAHLGGPIRR